MRREAPWPGALWALLFGNFAIGTGVMVVPGTLPELAASFSTSVAAVGQLITAGALVVCVGAPLLAGMAAGWDRRRLLALSLAWFAVGHLLAALMPTLGTLLPVRMATLVAPAIFTPQAAACVGLLVAPHRRASAVAFIFLGWSLASVLGLPMAAFLGGHLGWRAAFAVIAVFTALGSVWIWRTMPDGIRPPPLSREGWRKVLFHPVLMAVVAITLLQAAGQFVLFSYFGPLLVQQFQASPAQLSMIWLWLGLCGVVGNLLATRYMDKLGSGGMAMVAMALISLSLLVWPLGLAGGWAALTALLLPWGLGCFAANSSQQARLVALAPGLATASIALNSSAMYLGQAAGAATGGWLLARGPSSWMNWCGLACLVSAMLLSVHVARRRRSL
ncbi:MFS transporter [Pseudacidovorax sp. RU35E]|uniref:MFS transporter n=1 Tax=Pseudacidovorax sp. RU35E TaxID=1907403 RepID=UPI0009558DF1|nr:MFS transporter [Pseudacidovorax sp. RU35E]SIQ00426.1 Predicted arabinose efflux permease, MFS family [Pseudacidovorax sp. RU35E]